VPPFAVIAGNPGKIVRYRFPQEVIEKLLKIAWWDRSAEEVEKMKEDFEDVEQFVKKYE
jgi:Asp-tRNA(Asn)/Glu-tRNA(Gln) amidotransferase C subunit